MATNPNPHLPTDPRVTDYENAVFVADELGPPLNRAIIAVVPADNGVARYVYDHSILIQIYADFREIDLDQDGAEDSTETNTERIEAIHETIRNISWGSPSEGAKPLLVTDPEVDPLGLDCKDEEPTVLVVNGKEFWVIS